MHSSSQYTTPAVALCGLNVVRSIGLAGIPVVVARYEDFNEVKFSKYTQAYHTIPHPFRQEEACLDKIISIAESLQEKPVLYYGDDVKLSFVSKHRERLSEYFHFLLPEESLLESFLNKGQFIDLANELGLAIPKSIVAGSLHSPDEIRDHLEFPIFVKPNLKKDWRDSPWRKFLKERPHKGFLVKDFDELTNVWEALVGISSDFILQEYIFGGDDEIYSYHSYVGRDRKLLGAYIGKKIRTYPRLSGASTYLELVHNDDVAEIGLETVTKLGLQGISKLDFKRDSRTGKYMVLEVNARFNLWNYLGAKNGVNLAEAAYRHLLGMEHKPQVTYSTKYHWISLENDVRALIEYRRHNEWTIFGWLKSLLKPKVYNYFSWDDPRPFLAKIQNFIMKRIRPAKKQSSARKTPPANGNVKDIQELSIEEGVHTKDTEIV